MLNLSANCCRTFGCPAKPAHRPTVVNVISSNRTSSRSRDATQFASSGAELHSLYWRILTLEHSEPGFRGCRGAMIRFRNRGIVRRPTLMKDRRSSVGVLFVHFDRRICTRGFAAQSTEPQPPSPEYRGHRTATRFERHRQRSSLVAGRRSYFDEAFPGLANGCWRRSEHNLFFPWSWASSRRIIASDRRCERPRTKQRILFGNDRRRVWTFRLSEEPKHVDENGLCIIRARIA